MCTIAVVQIEDIYIYSRLRPTHKHTRRILLIAKKDNNLVHFTHILVDAYASTCIFFLFFQYLSLTKVRLTKRLIGANGDEYL